ncbi:hypothetical protein FRX31_003248 [Thalictrum thalictroides]|uniref:Uncharacterized protein n=1 Tax=Thalictrum thalictroides TaxID=46969 RepID=A0A7J6XE70_THATH|nr:hypothetical protein FRX31_003248 [Thalictrum thalictroides]
MLFNLKDFNFVLSHRQGFGYKVDDFILKEKCFDRDVTQIFKEILGVITSLEVNIRLQRKFVYYLLEKSGPMEYLYRVYRERSNAQNCREELSDCIPAFIQCVVDLWFTFINVIVNIYCTTTFWTTLFRHYYEGGGCEITRNHWVPFLAPIVFAV